MSTNMNGTRGNSQSPPGSKQNGGVALPNGQKLDDCERAANTKSPYKPGFTHGNNATKLSAGASSFKPGPAPISLLNKNSTADTPEPITAKDQPIIVTSPNPKPWKGSVDMSKAAAQQPIGTRSNSHTPPMKTVHFTTDFGPTIDFQGSHYLKFDGLTKSSIVNWDDMMVDLDLERMLRGMKTVPSQDGSRFTFYFYVDDIRDTQISHDRFEMMQIGRVAFITQTEYAGVPEGEASHDKSSYHDGQVVFVAVFDGPTADFVAKTATKVVHTVAGSFGELRAFAPVASAAYPNLEFRTEYYKITDAKKALGAATKDAPHVVDNWKIHAKELPNFTVAVDTGVNGDSITNGMAGIRIVGTPPQGGDANGTGNYSSPTGRSTWRINEKGEQEPMKPIRVLPKVGNVPLGMSILQSVQTPQREQRFHSAPTPYTPAHLMQGGNMPPRSESWNGYDNHGSRYAFSHNSPTRQIPGPQAVDIHKIEIGQDVRTTTMLRNIPNRMTCHQLKEVLDQHCWGAYDFSYLRIDFEMGTNVGYAFVNFADPMDIIPFVNEHVGKRWQPNNDRRVEMSYATVQGYDCLVEKFRNSAIMSEYKDFRPKLWWTFMNAPKDGMVGTEAPFPGPNNLSKKQRSLDNAGQIGLYAPRSGHVSRERGRHSQFDRGITYQQQMSPIQNGYYSNGSTSYGSNSYAYNGYGGNGYGGNGFDPRMAGPRMAGPPPQFQHAVYPNGYNVNQYPGFTDPFANQYQYGSFDGGDVFGGNYNGEYNNGGYNNGYNNNTTPFGVGPGTPSSRLRTQTGGKLGGRPKKVNTMGGPVQSPRGEYGYSSPDGHMPPVLEAEDEAQGYNNTLGPHYCPKY